MPRNKDIIAAGLSDIPASARKAFLTRVFGSEDYKEKTSALRRESPSSLNSCARTCTPSRIFSSTVKEVTFIVV